MRRRPLLNPRGHVQWKSTPGHATPGLIQNIPRRCPEATEPALPFHVELLVVGALFTSNAPLLHADREGNRTSPPTLSVSYYDAETIVLRNAVLMYTGTVRVAQKKTYAKASSVTTLMVIRHTFVAGNAMYIIDLSNVSPVA